MLPRAPFSCFVYHILRIYIIQSDAKLLSEFEFIGHGNLDNNIESLSIPSVLRKIMLVSRQKLRLCKLWHRTLYSWREYRNPKSVQSRNRNAVLPMRRNTQNQSQWKFLEQHRMDGSGTGELYPLLLSFPARRCNKMHVFCVPFRVTTFNYRHFQTLRVRVECNVVSVKGPTASSLHSLTFYDRRVFTKESGVGRTSVTFH
jgi:hypothetical protein